MAKKVPSRKPILDAAQTNVLTKSRRRCCLCFWLDGKDELVKGQMAHLDHDPSNSGEDNLAFLCLDHHDDYDSTPRLSKKLREKEVRHWRDELYREMAYRFRDHTLEAEKRKEEFRYLEKVAGDLLQSLRKDVKADPLGRLISLTSPDVRHSGPRNIFLYFYRDIPRLLEKAELLANYGLLRHDEDTFFWITEQLAAYLRSS